MRHILLFGLMLASFLSYSQYPASGAKQRLGWQTTGDGLVYRGAIADTATINPGGLNNAWMLLDTVNGNLYAYREHWWQLVSGGGGLTMPFNSVTFNVNETDASEQELQYSADKGYLQYGGLDSVQIPLLPGIWYVRNDTSVTIPKGTVVRASGTLGASGRIKVKHMIADGSIPAMYVLGIAMQDIAVGADGYVMTQGKIRQVNTTAYSEGAVLYADVDTLGGLTQTEPGNGYLKLPIAFVVHSASNGTLAVRIDAGSSLHDLHDVDTDGRVDGSVLRYDSTAGYWKASTTAGITAGDTSVFVRQYQLSGTSGYLPKYTTDTTLGNSPLYNPSGNKIMLGYTSPNVFTTGIEVHSATSGTGTAQSSIDVYHGASGFADFTGRFQINRSRANTVGSFTKVNNGDWLGRYMFNGADGAKYVTGAQIYAITDATTGLDSMPTALRFATNPGNTLTPTDRMSITSTGRVGIGTTTPDFKLSVLGADNCCGTPRISAQFRDGLNSAFYIAHTGPHPTPGYATLLGSSDDLAFGQIQSGGTSEYMRIKASTGRVGIGTSSPARSLHISATDAVRIPAGTNAQQTGGDAGDLRLNTDDSNLRFYDNTGWRAVMQSSNTVGRGTAGRVFYADVDGRVAGDEPLYWDATNNRLGINQATPIAPLDVNGGARITTVLEVPNIRNGITANNVLTLAGNAAASGNTATSENIAFNVGNNGATKAMTILNNGRVGIGTASPDSTLQVNGAIRATRLAVNTFGSQIFDLNNYGPAGMDGVNVWIGNGGQKSAASSPGTSWGSYNVAIGGDALVENTTGNGNMAIGSRTLQVNTTGANNVAIGNQALGLNVNGGANMAIGSQAMYNNTSGGESVAIGYTALQNANATANVAIGYSAQYAKTSGDYDVAIGWMAGRYQTATFGAQVTNSSESVFIGAAAYPGKNNPTNMIVIGPGAVGNGDNTTTIGRSTTTHTVFQYGETLVGYSAAQDNGNYRLQVNGQIFATNATIATSDARLKENIEPLPSGLKEVMSLKPCTFDFRKDTGLNLSTDKQVGFIAQDVAATVQGTGYEKALIQEAGGNLALAETKLIPLLVKAIQEQQAQIEALKKEIEQLKNK